MKLITSEWLSNLISGIRIFCKNKDNCMYFHIQLHDLLSTYAINKKFTWLNYECFNAGFITTLLFNHCFLFNVCEKHLKPRHKWNERLTSVIIWWNVKSLLDHFSVSIWNYNIKKYIIEYTRRTTANEYWQWSTDSLYQDAELETCNFQKKLICFIYSIKVCKLHLVSIL